MSNLLKRIAKVEISKELLLKDKDIPYIFNILEIRVLGSNYKVWNNTIEYVICSPYLEIVEDGCEMPTVNIVVTKAFANQIICEFKENK